MDSLHQGGADPLMVLQDLLDLSHFVTRLKLTPEAGTGDPLEEGDRERARPLAEALSIPVLTRAWQMLLKGIEEVQQAPNPAQAATMVLIRLAYVADMPAPADLVRALASGESVPRVSGVAAAPRAAPPASSSANAVRAMAAAPAVAVASASPDPTPAAEAAPVPEFDPLPQSFAELIELFDKHREAITRAHLWAHVHLVAYEPGRIEFRPAEGAPRDLSSRLMQLLGEWTGKRWAVVISQAAGAPTLAEQAAQRDGELRSEVAVHPLVRAVLDMFPGATIAAVRERQPTSEAGIDDAAIEIGDDETDTGEDEP
jgi:DNA polymerase-3 subunit gamma/tau